jgi:hypothetical protein
MTTEAATAAPASVTATDLITAPAAPAAPATPSFMPAGFPATPEVFNAPEAVAARKEIELLKSDKEFGKRLLAKDPAAFAQWSAAHKAGYPAAQQITSAEDVNSQVAARVAQEWDTHFTWLRQRFDLTPEHQAEVKAGVIRADIHQWAKDEKDRLIRDKNWYRRLLDGDRKASDEWERIKLMLSLRPVKV